MFFYLFDGRLSYFVRVLPDALQEVSQLCHGRVPDLRPQFGDVFCHDGAEPVLTRLGKTRLLQLLQSAQSRVVPTVTQKDTPQLKSPSSFILSDDFLRTLFKLQVIGSHLCKSSGKLQSFAYGQGDTCKINTYMTLNFVLADA